MDNNYIEDDCQHWENPERWEPEWIPADDPQPPKPLMLLSAWSITTPAVTRFAYEGTKQVLIKIRAEGHDGKAPLAYRRSEAEHKLVMDAYQDRIHGKAFAQERWNAISAGACQGLTVEESLRKFGRLPELS